jgi:hypothetical protein
MKKLVSNSNPFILLLAPVVFAIIMGVSYQFEQKKQFTAHATRQCRLHPYLLKV